MKVFVCGLPTAYTNMIKTGATQKNKNDATRSVGKKIIFLCICSLIWAMLNGLKLFCTESI